jgi:hypothetical protein
MLRLFVIVDLQRQWETHTPLFGRQLVHTGPGLMTDLGFFSFMVEKEEKGFGGVSP